jgi:hypothetical protein
LQVTGGRNIITVRNTGDERIGVREDVEKPDER